MPHRIETYVHSDGLTQNKGGCMVMVSTQTDFALKSPAFIRFCQDVAKFSYAGQCADWEATVSQFPELLTSHAVLEGKEKPNGLGEKVVVNRVCIFYPTGGVSLGG